jgi:hypothetical protein
MYLCHPIPFKKNNGINLVVEVEKEDKDKDKDKE